MIVEVVDGLAVNRDVIHTVERAAVDGEDERRKVRIHYIDDESIDEFVFENENQAKYVFLNLINRPVASKVWEGAEYPVVEKFRSIEE